MQFTVGERYILFNLLETKESDIATMLTTKKLRNALAFTEEEVNEINWRDDPDEPGVVRWDREVSNPPDILVTKHARTLIASRLRELSDSGKISENHVNLFLEFVGAPTEESETE